MEGVKIDTVKRLIEIFGEAKAEDLMDDIKKDIDPDIVIDLFYRGYDYYDIKLLLTDPGRETFAYTMAEFRVLSLKAWEFLRQDMSKMAQSFTERSRSLAISLRKIHTREAGPSKIQIKKEKSQAKNWPKWKKRRRM